jgi:predicted dehydrogenase
MIRTLLIGAGAVVDEHYCAPLSHLEKTGAVQVGGVVDPNQSRGQQVSARFKSARHYPSIGAAFSAGAFDLVVIASPPAMHADDACAAFEQGCHVLCEKPMTTSLADANRMNAAAHEANRILGVAFPRRFYANFADVAKLVASGELGSDLQFTFREGDLYTWAVKTGAAFQREESRGGVLLDKGVHMLDQLIAIFGNPLVERAFDDSLAGGVETNSRLELAFPHARGTSHVSWEYSMNNGLRIWGDAGEVRLDGVDVRTYERKTRDGWVRVPATTDWPADMKPAGGKRLRPANSHACFEPQLIAMLRCIAYGEPFPVTGVQAAIVQATVEDAYARAEPIECPWLSDAEQAAAREKHWKSAPVG